MMDLKGKIILLLMISIMAFLTLDLRRQNLELNKEIDLVKKNLEDINEYYLKKNLRLNLYDNFDIKKYDQLSIENFRNFNENLFNLNH